ncbi:MAG TPA: tetratricopeptide repeat protein [Candidatus Nitrosotalea sp.]|nr:tetratricopeptide repeat protein [Candidatus Nitrosotalea sp.]
MRRLLPVVIAILAMATFLPALDGQFLTWDDDVNLVTNEAYRGLGWPQLRWAFSNVRMGHYIPLTWLTFSLNYATGAMNPWGYHALNLVLHGANAALFYLIARRLVAAARAGGRQDGYQDAITEWGAAAAALVFALHPLRVESVAWITERRDVLSGFFFLAAVLAYLRSVEAGHRVERPWLAASLLLFTGGLLSKASVMVLPAVLVLLDAYPLRRGALPWRRLFVEKIGYWALGLIGAVGALVALRVSGLRITSYGSYGPEARAAMVAYTFWFYPSAWVWPVRLSPLYELPGTVDPLAWRFLGPIMGLIAVTAVLWTLRDRWPAGLAAWAYSALVLLPISGVVHSGFQLAHDRYSYLSGLGLALLAGGAVCWLLTAAGARRVSPGVLVLALTAAALVVTTLAIGSWQQARIWRDSETLWRWAVEADPRCALCANNLASLLLNSHPRSAGELGEAEALARRAVALNPAYDSPYNTLGAILAARHDDRGAEAAFRQAMQLAPERVVSTANLGALFARNGRYAEALPLLRTARVKDPRNVDVRENLRLASHNQGVAAMRAGRLDEAVTLFEEVADITPDDADAHRTLGLLLWIQGQRDAARVHLERAVALRPTEEGLRALLTRFQTDPDHPPALQ